MRRNRRDSIRKERIIMIASSAFVLTALTMTGLYMKGQEAKQQDDGYTLDFSALGEQDEDPLEQIGMEQAKNNSKQTKEQNQAKSNTNQGKTNSQMRNKANEKDTILGKKPNSVTQNNVLNNDLDYMPADNSAQVDSHGVQIPGLTGSNISEAPKKNPTDNSSNDASDNTEANGEAVEKELHFEENEGLLKPVSGEVLMPYSMDGSIYFATLDQYKYNPATILSAEEGSDVVACADGKVIRVFDDAELGHGIVLDLGDGYQVTYGQLTDLAVSENSYVEAGERIGSVAAPSKYFVKEGTNLYLRMDKDSHPVSAEAFF